MFCNWHLEFLIIYFHFKWSLMWQWHLHTSREDMGPQSIHGWAQAWGYATQSLAWQSDIHQQVWGRTGHHRAPRWQAGLRPRLMAVTVVTAEATVATVMGEEWEKKGGTLTGTMVRGQLAHPSLESFPKSLQKYLTFWPEPYSSKLSQSKDLPMDTAIKWTGSY